MISFVYRYYRLPAVSVYIVFGHIYAPLFFRLVRLWFAPIVLVVFGRIVTEFFTERISFFHQPIDPLGVYRGVKHLVDPCRNSTVTIKGFF